MTYCVYELLCTPTGAVYIGMTGRDIEMRKSEHFSRAMSNSNGCPRLTTAIQNYPNPSDWVIRPIWVTPIYPECKLMEAAFIYQFDNMYWTLNSTFPAVNDSVSLSAAYSVLTNVPVSTMPYEWRQLEDFPGVYVYRGVSDKYWKYGYRGRGDSDEIGLWKEFITDDQNIDDAYFTATKYFETYSEPCEVDMMDTEFDCSMGDSVPECGVGMTEQHLMLTIMQEELGEVAIELMSIQQTISKALRFGLHEVREGFPANYERVRDEFNDLLGSVIALSKYGFDLKPDLDKIAAKVEKIEKYKKYSTELGIIGHVEANSRQSA